MRSLAPLCLVIAGCSNTAFVDLRITAPAGVDRVELFIAPEQCTPGLQVDKCAQAMAWDEASRKVAGTVYILDVDATTVADRLENGSYRIDLRARPKAETDDDPYAKYDRHHIARMLLVGYSDSSPEPVAAAVLKDVQLPASDAQTWEIALVPFDPVPPVMPTVKRPAGDADRLHTWNRASDSLARCAVIERWREGEEVVREFLVPAADTDCDDNAAIDDPNAECDPYWWNAPPRSPGLDKLSCATKDFAVRGLVAHTCQLGGPACSETSPLETACTPVAPAHCVATAVCEPSCLSNPQDCFSSGALAHVYCHTYASLQGAVCAGSNSAAVDLLPLIPGTISTTVTCAGAPLFAPIAQLLGGFTPSATLGPSVTVIAAPAEPTLNAPCRPTISWTGMTNPSGTTASLSYYGAMAVPFTNDTTSVIGFKLEVEFKACDITTPYQMVCETFVDPQDDAAQCAAAPPEL